MTHDHEWPAGAIEPPEYRSRQEHARRLARERGFEAVIAWSRAGATQDHYADVYHLTGFYTHQPFVPDLALAAGPERASAWRWRAAGHAAVIVPAEGPVTLVADSESRQDPPPVSDRVIVSADPVRAVADAVKERLPSGPGAAGRRPRRIALLGGEALAMRWATTLAGELGEATLIEADDLAARLRMLKSPAEQALLRAAGALGSRAMHAAMAAAVPGATEADVAAALIGEVVRHGGAFYGLGVSSGPLAHTFAPSGGPAGTAGYTTRRLAAGDMLRIDAYGSVGGYLFDFARSRVVGRSATREQRELLDAVRDSVCAGVELLRPGTSIAAVARRCHEVLSRSRYVQRCGLPESTMGGTWGHGLGLSFEPPWIDADSDAVVEAGMCLAIERRIEASPVGGAQYEDNVIVTDGGPEIVTSAPGAYES